MRRAPGVAAGGVGAVVVVAVAAGRLVAGLVVAQGAVVGRLAARARHLVGHGRRPTCCARAPLGCWRPHETGRARSLAAAVSPAVCLGARAPPLGAHCWALKCVWGCPAANWAPDDGDTGSWL